MTYADDFVLATGRTESVRDFCRLVFEQLDLNYEDHVEIDPRYFRPAEVDLLLGDASKAQRRNWAGLLPPTSRNLLES